MLKEWKRVSQKYYDQTAKLYDGAYDLLKLMKQNRQIGIKFKSPCKPHGFFV